MDEISVKYEHGFASLSVPLPSRRERCVFTLLPATQTLGDFVNYLEEEDRGTDHVAVYTLDGERVAKSTPIDVLLRQDFHVVINDQRFLALIPDGTGTKMSVNANSSLSDIKNSIAQLYSALNIEDHQLRQERHLLNQLEQLRAELEPFQALKDEMAAKARKRADTLTWLGLGLMGLQFGLLARLTWWEYSWDIMEPVTYFVGYGSAIAMFAYYILTRQDYVVPDVRDREYLFTLHRVAEKLNLDINRYNELCEKISQTEYDLERLHDPLHLHLPAEYLQKLNQSN
jgi:hypothetical protein